MNHQEILNNSVVRKQSFSLLKLIKMIKRNKLKNESSRHHAIYSNPHILIIDAISGALFTLRIQYGYTRTQCDEGARDGIDNWYMGIIRLILYHTV